MSLLQSIRRMAVRDAVRSLLVAGLIAVGCLGTTSVVFAAADDAESYLVQPSFFGMHFNWVFTPPAGKPRTVIPSGPITGWRLHDTRVRWADLQPARDRWNFDTLDAAVSLAQQKGIQPLYVLGSTPTWASARPDEKCQYGMGCSAEPSSLADWENYVRTVASRYRGKITLYELWNEPKLSDVQRNTGNAFFTGSTQSMLKLAEIAYRVLKEVDPANQLASPGFTVHVAFLEKYLVAGGAKYADAVAFHFYIGTPEAMPERIRQVRDIMKRTGLGDRPLWNTEQFFELLPAGVSAPGPSGFGVENVGMMSAYVQRAHILAAANGVSRMYWYGYDVSMAGPDGSPGPVTIAYNTVARWLTGSRIGPCSAPETNVTVCPLKRGNDQAFIVWRVRDPGDFRPPKSWGSTRVESATGATSDLPGSAVTIGPAPMLFKVARSPWGAVAK